MEEEESPEYLIVSVEDSPDARHFIELSSHAADLAEALGALGWAQQPTTDSEMVIVKASLISSAVVSYCRCFMASKVRRQLSDFIRIPPEMIATHDAIMAFRNQTVAHSQSELAVTYSLGVVDAKTLELQHVSAVTVMSPLPDSLASDFGRLIRVTADLLDDMIDPIRRRLEEGLRAADPETLAPAEPRGIDKFASDFRPRSKRSRYPTAHAFYWDCEAAPSVTGLKPGAAD